MELINMKLLLLYFMLAFMGLLMAVIIDLYQEKTSPLQCGRSMTPLQLQAYRNQ